MLPSGLVVARVDADDVAPRSTWATVARAHINKATLASLGSRSSRRRQCRVTRSACLTLLGTGAHGLEL